MGGIKGLYVAVLVESRASPPGHDAAYVGGRRARRPSLHRMTVLARHWLMRRCHRQQKRLLRNDDPPEHIRDDAREDSARKRDEEPENAYERCVEIQILSQPGTNARDLSVSARAHQFLRRGRNPHHVSAVGAIPAVLSDDLTASVAVHGWPPLLMIRRWLGKCSKIKLFGS